MRSGLFASLCLALLVILCAGSATAQVRSPSAESFAEPPFFHDPELSPDGRRLVAKSVVDGITAVLVADLAKEDLGLIRKPLPENRPLLWARWAGNERILLSILSPVKLLGIEFPTTRLFIYDLPTSTFRMIEGKVGGLDGDDVIHVDPSGKYILLSTQKSIIDYPGVWRVDLSTLAMEQIVKPQSRVLSWYADPEGVVRAGIGAEGRRWWILYRGPGETKFRKIVKGRVSNKEQESDIDRVIPVVGSDKGYAIANKQTGRYALYHYDFATDMLGEPVFEHPQVDVESVTYSSATGRVEAIEYTDDRDRIHWLDPEMKAIQARIDRTFPQSINRVVSKSEDGKTMLVWAGGAADPGAYYVYNIPTRKIAELVRPHTVEPAALSAMEAVKYTARDGLEIPAYLTLPKGRGRKALPFVVMPHGGPFVRDKWTYDPWVQFLASRGYAVLQPNFRGSTGYGRAFVEAGEGQWGRKMQDDIDDGVRWLTQQGIAHPGRVCIMGASYGGYAALWAAARNPDIYRCAISFAGISDVRAMLRYDSRGFAARRYYRDWRDKVKGEGKFDLESISPIKAVNRMAIPLLIGHGADDSNVPSSQSAKLHEALQKAGKPHEYILYKDEGHNLEDPKNLADFLKRVEGFLARHNPAV